MVLFDFFVESVGKYKNCLLWEMAGSSLSSFIPGRHTTCLPLFRKKTDRNGTMNPSDESKEPQTSENSDAEATFTPSEKIGNQEQHSKHSTPGKIPASILKNFRFGCYFSKVPDSASVDQIIMGGARI